MPVKPKSDETEQDFIGRCMSEEKESFPETDQRYAVCKSKWDNREEMESEEDENAQQGGVVSAGFGRTKFEYPPTSKETMSNFMARCMSDDMVRERKQDRAGRASFCYSQYQQKYILSLAKRWK